MKLAKTMKEDQDIVICLSGRGDKGEVPIVHQRANCQMFRVLPRSFLDLVRKLAGISGFKANLVSIAILKLKLNGKWTAD